MKVSGKCLDLIKRFEGFRSKPYLCPSGVWTIGYGHTNGVTRDSRPITEDEAEDLLRQDVMVTVAGLPQEELERLSQNRQDAIVSFAFNLGAGAFNESTLRQVIRTEPENLEEIRRQFLRWVYAQGTRQEGLVRRREAESDLYCNG